jgi:dTDP-D-glucose 4,6-dehydratase
MGGKDGMKTLVTGSAGMLANQILKIMGKPDSLLQSVKNRSGHNRRYAKDSVQHRSNAGWKPYISFDQSLSDTVRRHTKADKQLLWCYTN